MLTDAGPIADALSAVVAVPHPLSLGAIREALEASRQMAVIGEAYSGAEVLGLLPMVRPDVVLLDFDLAGPDGLACLGLLRQRDPRVSVVMLAAEREPRLIEQALRAGAVGCVLKSIEPCRLAGAIRQAVEGTLYTAVAASEDTASGERDARTALSDRDRMMLQALAGGLSDEAIASHLSLTVQAVRAHLPVLYRKLGVVSRTGAARYAYEHELA